MSDNFDVCVLDRILSWSKWLVDCDVEKDIINFLNTVIYAL